MVPPVGGKVAAEEAARMGATVTFFIESESVAMWIHSLPFLHFILALCFYRAMSFARFVLCPHTYPGLSDDRGDPEIQKPFLERVPARYIVGLCVHAVFAFSAIFMIVVDFMGC